MLCVLKGATLKPSSFSIRHKAHTKMLFPTWEPVPCIIIERFVIIVLMVEKFQSVSVITSIPACHNKIPYSKWYILNGKQKNVYGILLWMRGGWENYGE